MTDSIVPDDAGKAVENQQVTEPAGWNWADNVAGEGEKPDYLMDKYSNVAEQAKAYPELQSKFGGFTGAPDEYSMDLREDINLPEGVEIKLNPDDPLMGAALEFAKTTNMSQSSFTDMLTIYAEAQGRDYIDPQAHAGAQMALLGENADERIGNLAQWAKANFDDEGFEQFRRIATSADSIEVLERFVEIARPSAKPDPNAINPSTRSALEDELKALQSEKDDKGGIKWFTDQNHRAKIERLQKQLDTGGLDNTIIG